MGLQLGLRHHEKIVMRLPDGREIVLTRMYTGHQTPRICIDAPADVRIERVRLDGQGATHDRGSAGLDQA